jgi:hypothetical protein
MQPPFGAQASPGLQQPRPGPHQVPLVQCGASACACAANASAKAQAANSVRSSIVSFPPIEQNRFRRFRSEILMEHDLFGKPASTFPDHARADTLNRVVRAQL